MLHCVIQLNKSLSNYWHRGRKTGAEKQVGCYYVPDICVNRK